MRAECERTAARTAVGTVSALRPRSAGGRPRTAPRSAARGAALVRGLHLALRTALLSESLARSLSLGGPDLPNYANK